MKKLVVTLALLTVTSIAYADENYFVAAKIYDNGKLIGSPAFLVEPNKQAGMILAESYDLKVSVDPINKNSLSVNTSLFVGGEHIAPSMLVELGKESSVTIGSKSLSVLVSKTIH